VRTRPFEFSGNEALPSFKYSFLKTHDNRITIQPSRLYSGGKPIHILKPRKIEYPYLMGKNIIGSFKID